MYSVKVRDHVMIAHSFRGEVFGPAQRLHGATLIVDVELWRPELDADGVVVDIGLLSRAVKDVLSAFDYRNLDDLPDLAGKNTTIEFLAGEIHQRMCARARDGALGAGAADLRRMRVVIKESHVAEAAYDGPVAR